MKVAVCMYRAKYSQLFRSAVSNGRGFPETSFCFVFYPTEGFLQHSGSISFPQTCR